jgi:uncharacterized protein YneF (UPF0154 family)
MHKFLTLLLFYSFSFLLISGFLYKIFADKNKTNQNPPITPPFAKAMLKHCPTKNR